MGASYVTTYDGRYYVALSVTATTPPTFTGVSTTISDALSPILDGTSTTQAAPPAVGATLAAPTVSGKLAYFLAA
jgi:hypothetical protein